MIAIKQLEVAFGMAKAFVKKVKKSSGAGGLAGERGRERFASSAAPAGHDGAITNVRWPSASSRAGGSRPRSLVMVVEKLERFLKELKIVGMRAPRCQGEFSKRRGWRPWKEGANSGQMVFQGVGRFLLEKRMATLERGGEGRVRRG